MDWRPIETAPRDHTRILLYVPGSRIAEVVFGWSGEDKGEWMMDCGDSAFPIDLDVTHWAPEPDTP